MYFSHKGVHRKEDLVMLRFGLLYITLQGEAHAGSSYHCRSLFIFYQDGPLFTPGRTPIYHVPTKLTLPYVLGERPLSITLRQVDAHSL